MRKHAGLFLIAPLSMELARGGAAAGGANRVAPDISPVCAIYRRHIVVHLELSCRDEKLLVFHIMHQLVFCLLQTLLAPLLLPMIPPVPALPA